MSPSLLKGIMLVGLSVSFLGSLLLVAGARRKPWKMQSWNGETPAEVKEARTVKLLNSWGAGLLAVGFALQFGATCFAP